VAEETLAPWREVVRELLALDMEPGDKGPRPLLLKLTADARPRWKALMDAMTREMNGEDFPPHLRGPWAKLKVHASRLALIVHLLRYVCDEPVDRDVDGESVRRAALLVDYFQGHVKKVLATIGADPKVAQARRVLASLARNRDLDDFTRADLFQLVRGRFDQPEHLDAPLALLVSHGYLRSYTPDRPKGQRGPNPARYLVNPLWDRDVSDDPSTCRETSSAGVTGDTGVSGLDGETRVTPVTPAQKKGEDGDADGDLTDPFG
jgi:hypothetical protein